MASYPDTPVFEKCEQEQLGANECLRPYIGITKAQLAGLLSALGEYALRLGPTPGPLDGKPHDPQVAERLYALAAFYGWDRTTRCTGPGDQFVFDAGVRKELAFHKYVKGNEDISKREAVDLLDALGRYSMIAPRIEQYFGDFEGHARAIHAHNALVAFRDRPFTQGEFGESVRAVVSGSPSLV